MKKTGEMLRLRREAAGLSLSEVALATKINPRVLAAIENGDEARLPARTFLKGFIRSYAIFLKTDTEEVMRSYLEECGGPPTPAIEPAPGTPTESPPSTAPLPKRSKVPDESSSGMRTLAVVLIIALIGMIIGVRELIEKYQKENLVAGEVKVTPLTTPAAEPAAAQGIPPVLAAPEKAKDTPPAEEPESRAESAAAEPPPAASLPAQTPQPPTEETEVRAAEKPVDTKTTGRNEVILEALDTVEIKLETHGESRKISLAPTQVHTVQVEGPLTLELSDGGAVNLIVNGQERGPAGPLGKSKKVTIP